MTTFTSPAWVHGSMPKIWEYAIIHLRASGPCSFESLRYWLLEQAPGVDTDNVDRITQEFIDSAAERRVVTVDTLGYIEYVYPTKF